MRVGLDVQSTIGKKTGIGYYCSNILSELKNKMGVQIVPFSDPRVQNMGTLARMFWENFKLPSDARKEKLDIFHFPGFAGSITKKGKYKKVTTVHDLIGMIYPENLGKASRFYWQKWLPACVRNSDMTIAISEKTKSDIVRLLRIPEEKIKVIYQAAAESFVAVKDAAELERVRERYSLSENFMLNVGTVEPRKNLSLLLEAFSGYLDRSGSDLELVISGKKDWGYDKVVHKIEELGLSLKVKFTDYVVDQDMAALYSLAKFFVFPSLYEGFGLPVIEAMACARPVICSNSSSLPEVVQDAAILVNPFDVKELERAIERFDADGRAREEYSASAVIQAAKFSWKKTADKTVEVYKEVLGG